MKVVAITATAGRHTCLERSLALFLNQTYDNRFLLIYQNSPVYQQLDESVDQSKVLLVNNHLSLKTGKRYENLGAIYNDALTLVPKDADVIIFWDDDDLFKSNHIEEGVKGLVRSGKSAYKPKYSFFRHSDGISKMENTLEPSIFIKSSVIFDVGFDDTTSTQHLKWVNHLVYNNDIVADPDGIPTLIYNWGDKDMFTYKTSGRQGAPDNFESYHKYSVDHGDKIVTPRISPELLLTIESLE